MGKAEIALTKQLLPQSLTLKCWPRLTWLFFIVLKVLSQGLKQVNQMVLTNKLHYLWI